MFMGGDLELYFTNLVSLFLTWEQMHMNIVNLGFMTGLFLSFLA